MKQFFTFSFVVISSFLVSNLYAQDTSSVTWQLQTDFSFLVSGNVNGANATTLGLSSAYEIPASGTTNKVQKNKPDATTSDASGTGAWPDESGANSNRYIQFSLSPQLNTIFCARTISMLLGAKGVNTLNASIYSSTDSSFISKTLIAQQSNLTSNAVNQLSFNFSDSVVSGQTLYIRIYPWSSVQITSTTKYLYIGNVIVSGITFNIPVQAAALWPLQSSQGAITNGLVNAKDQSFSNLGSYSYVQLGGESCDGIITLPLNSGTWPAESNPNFNRYIQYSVAPKPGGKFYVDSISFKLGAQFTNKLRAAVYFSRDTSFINKTFLVDTALSSSNLVFTGFRVNDIVTGTDAFYVRIYPYDTQAEGFAKLICVDSVMISGATTGIAAAMATLSTKSLSYISTTFATSGGNITSDGGGTKTTRGVCWDTTRPPTIFTNKTVDGSGIGSFTSRLNGLKPGKKYYVSAYATNISGTAYGNVDSLITLDSIVVPSVTTTSVSNILNKSAQSGGTVTDWGGDTVKSRGVCYSRTNSIPTIADIKTVDGSDIGSFNSALVGLSPSSKYYVRAYATNSAGTNYGAVVTFTTQATSPSVKKVVAQDGSGDYATLQAAFDAIPQNYTGTYTVYLKNGIYKEKVLLDSNRVNVVLVGENRDSTIITYDDYSGRVVNGVTLGTSTSYSVSIDVSDFTAQNITFQNTSQAAQAVALETNGDRQSYYNCKIVGFQDTYYSRGAHGTDRIYMKNCYLEGSVDFIFGRDIVVFDSCEIHENRNSGTLTAGSTDASSLFGYVFLDCKITADLIGFDGNPVVHFYLGRPWQAAPRTVFINCYEPANLDSTGWLEWNVTPGLYAEYNCYGPGYKPTYRTSALSNQLTSIEASQYTIQNIFSRNSNPGFSTDWIPNELFITAVEINQQNQIPTNYSLLQNYPNPFNPTTKIQYALPLAGHVRLTVYNILGQVIIKLVDETQKAGNHEINFNADKLSSGIYFYRLEANNFQLTKKMALIK